MKVIVLRLFLPPGENIWTAEGFHWCLWFCAQIPINCLLDWFLEMTSELRNEGLIDIRNIHIRQTYRLFHYIETEFNSIIELH